MWCCNLRSNVFVAEDIHWSVCRVHGIRKGGMHVNAWSCVPTATVMIEDDTYRAVADLGF